MLLDMDRLHTELSDDRAGARRSEGRPGFVGKNHVAASFTRPRMNRRTFSAVANVMLPLSRRRPTNFPSLTESRPNVLSAIPLLARNASISLRRTSR